MFGCGTVLPIDYDAPPVCVCLGERPAEPPPAQPAQIEPCRHRGVALKQIKVRCRVGCAQLYWAHRCELFKRCVPTYPGPWDEDHDLEAKLYHLCGTCQDREP